MKIEIDKAVLSCLSFDEAKLGQLSDEDYDLARTALGKFGLPIETIDAARRRYRSAGTNQ